MGKIKTEKKQMKKQQRANDTLSEQYSKFDSINTDSDEDTPKPKEKSQLPVISSSEQLEWMKEQGILSYMQGSHNVNIGLGKPLTEAQFKEMKDKEGGGAVIDCPKAD